MTHSVRTLVLAILVACSGAEDAKPTLAPADFHALVRAIEAAKIPVR